MQMCNNKKKRKEKKMCVEKFSAFISVLWLGEH